MELSEQGFLEELLAPRREMATCWTTLHQHNDLLLPPCWSLEASGDNPAFASSNPLQLLSLTHQPPATVFGDTRFAEAYHPLDVVHTYTVPPELEYAANYSHSNDAYASMVEDEEMCDLISNDHYGQCAEQRMMGMNSCKVEALEQAADINNGGVAGNIDAGSSYCFEKRSLRPKKLEGQPSKNLMAERRRRKRLNDRLSMLRSSYRQEEYHKNAFEEGPREFIYGEEDKQKQKKKKKKRSAGTKKVSGTRDAWTGWLSGTLAPPRN